MQRPRVAKAESGGDDLSPTAASRGLLRAFLIGLGLLGALAIGGQVLVQRSLDEQAGDARVVNLAGLQRSRSERLAKDMLATILNDQTSSVTAAELRLQTTMVAFKRTQRGLAEGSSALGLTTVDDPEATAQLAKADAEFEEFTGLIEETLALHANGESTTLAVLATLGAQERFFGEMDEFVTKLDEQSAANIARTRTLELSLLIVTLVMAGIGVGACAPALRRLRRSVSLVEALTKNSPEALLLVDDAGRVFHHNPAAERLLGGEVNGPLTIGELLDRPVAEESDIRTAPSLAELRRLDGNSLPVRVKTSEFEIEPGRQALIYVVHDRTVELQAEKRQRQTEKLEAIGVLAAGIAHEINTPTQFVGDNLSFIGESVEGLMELAGEVEAAVAASEGRAASEPDADSRPTGDAPAWKSLSNKLTEIDVEFIREELGPSIEQSVDGVQRVAQIVRAMKDFSHPGGNGREPADLNHALSTTSVVCCSEWRYVAKLALDLDPNLPKVPVFLGDIKQVFLNLIVNAAHAIDKPDDSTELGNITVRTFVEGDHAVVEVIDDGSGIPEEIRERIFEPFFTTKEVGKGTGQGLAICRRVVEEAHGGTLDFDLAESGRGTVFRLHLPLEIDGAPVPDKPTLASV